MEKNELTIIAYHEAGHAVMYYVTKKKHMGVSIIPDGSNLGIVKEAPIDTHSLSYNHYREAIIMMAGRIAESIYRAEEIDFSGCIMDAADYGVGFYDPGETLDAFLNYIFHYTHDLVKKWWPEIEMLAKELLDKKELSYVKAYKLIKETHKRRILGERYEEEKDKDKLMRKKLMEYGRKHKIQELKFKIESLQKKLETLIA